MTHTKALCWAKIGATEAAMIDVESIESVRERAAGCVVTLKSGREIKVADGFNDFVKRLGVCGVLLAAPKG